MIKTKITFKEWLKEEYKGYQVTFSRCDLEMAWNAVLENVEVDYDTFCDNLEKDHGGNN